MRLHFLCLIIIITIKHGKGDTSSCDAARFSCPLSFTSCPLWSSQQQSGLFDIGDLSISYRPSWNSSLVTPWQIQWMTASETCILLSSGTRPIQIILIGDSITRHLYTALQILLRGDIVAGALDEDLDELGLECRCDLQFSSKPCRKIIRYKQPISKECSGARIFNFGVSGPEHLGHNLTKIRGVLTAEATSVVLIGGWGLHNSLNAMPIIQGLVRPLALLSKAQPQYQMKLLCLGVHAIQSNHPPQYHSKQNNKKVERYNSLLKKECAKLDLPYFDSYSLTKNASSFDGLHYGLEVNTVKAQILLNWIRSEREGVPSSKVQLFLKP